MTAFRTAYVYVRKVYKTLQYSEEENGSPEPSSSF